MMLDIGNEAMFSCLMDIANNLNNALTMLKDMETYADNAAAVAGGLSVGDIYKTAAGELRIVV